MLNIELPDRVRFLLDLLHNCGHEAYVVGGCVRDSLIGIEPKDWDVCTSATPDEVEKLIEQHNSETETASEMYRTFNIGKRFGTITVVDDVGMSVEVTTFRADGYYNDCRHPNQVVFVDSLETDLSRRDFTINAMAYSEETGLIDYFGGVTDLDNQVIRCVGVPDERFNEDALRILRALRFASKYAFELEPKTKEAIHNCAELLYYIAVERIQKELIGILFGKNCRPVLMEFSDVICLLIPEMTECVGFSQNNKYHQYTVYEHMVVAVSEYHGDDIYVKLALLLHDIGKPLCYSEDENGGHFYGHAEPSALIVESVLRRLKFDTRTVDTVTLLVKYHDIIIAPTKKSVRKWLNKLGVGIFERLQSMRRADILAHKQGTQDERLKTLDEICDIEAALIKEDSVFTLRRLAINGNDVISLGIIPGKAVGILLNKALNAVINEEVDNDKHLLMEYLRLEITNAVEKTFQS